MPPPVCTDSTQRSCSRLCVDLAPLLNGTTNGTIMGTLNEPQTPRVLPVLPDKHSVTPAVMLTKMIGLGYLSRCTRNVRVDGVDGLNGTDGGTIAWGKSGWVSGCNRTVPADRRTYIWKIYEDDNNHNNGEDDSEDDSNDDDKKEILSDTVFLLETRRYRWRQAVEE